MFPTTAEKLRPPGYAALGLGGEDTGAPASEEDTALARAMFQDVELRRTQAYLRKEYHDVVVGSECVDWLLGEGVVQTRAAALVSQWALRLPSPEYADTWTSPICALHY